MDTMPVGKMEAGMLLKIDTLKVRYGEQTVLNVTSPVVMEEGDRIGVIGSNGAGKSTLIRSLIGLKKYEGHIETKLTPEEMAVHMQFNSYPAALSCRHVMERILQIRIEDSEELKELIAYFEFEECLHKRYSSLSGGQKQRFTIIMVMFQRAELTFYDEVTSGLDFETRNRLMEKLNEWYQKREGAVVIVSHYYEELERLAEKLLILDQGQVVAYGRKADLFCKYCGRSVILLEDNSRNRRLIEGERQILAPKYSLAVTSVSAKQEAALVDRLIQKNVNFRRSDCDIELLYINAKRQRKEALSDE